MQIETYTGPAVLNDGASPRLRSTRDASLATQDAHGRYTEAASRNAIFTASNTSGVATQGSLSATTPPLTLYNPAGSNIVLYILFAGITVAAAPSGAANVVLAYNLATAAAPTSTTAATVQPGVLGRSQQPVGQAYRIATLAATPVTCFQLFSVLATGSTSTAGGLFEIAGALGVGPGVAISVQSITTALTVICSITWEELPV